MIVLCTDEECVSLKISKMCSKELHQAHLGIVKMKAIVRSFVYWKLIDRYIEENTRNCADCVRHKSDSMKANFHYSDYPSMLWERIHVDFAGTVF